MNCKIYKKKLSGSLKMKDINSSKIFTKKNYSSLIYILFSSKTQTLKILDTKEDYKKLVSEGYEPIGNKVGSKRELRLIQIVIAELSKEKIIRGNNLFKSIICYLNNLGFATNSTQKKAKKLLVTT